MKTYLDVTIRILPGAGQGGGGGLTPRPGSYRILIESPMGQGQSTLELPFAREDLAGVVFGVAETDRSLASVKPPAPAPTAGRMNVRDFGERLYEALFTGEVRTIFDRTVGSAEARQDTGVRIRLAMDLLEHGMAEVASLPWELMRAPRQPSPLVMSNRTLLVRSPDVPQRTDPSSYQPPLRILAVVSNPTGTAPLNLEDERAKIAKNWALVPGVKVDFVRPVRSYILNQLAAVDYHVIHYMGHGEYSPDTGGSLLLENEDGSPDPIGGEAIGVYLADELPTLRLVFLNACKTGTSSGHEGIDPFAGVATSLIRAGVPAVVAMQFPVSDKAAIAFADTFYQRIAQSYPVDAAMAEARKLLYSEAQAEWATPVLFLRSKDGVLFTDAPLPDPPPRGREQPDTNPDAFRYFVAGDQSDLPADAFRVLLAAPAEKLRPLHRMLKTKLVAAGVRVVDAIPPPYDGKGHEAAVRALAQEADLFIHLLGESPGEPIEDDADGGQTYPVAQLQIGLEAARSQVVLIPDEIDIENIEEAKYKALARTLIDRPRDSGRFELVRAGRHQLADEVMAKLRRLDEARKAARPNGASGSAIGSAFVDAHKVDLSSAQKLESFLTNMDIDVTKKTYGGGPGAAMSPFDIELINFPLYIVVWGSVDKAWVENRWKVAMKSAVAQDAKSIIAVLFAPERGPMKFQIRYDCVDDGSAKEALMAQFARGLE